MTGLERILLMAAIAISFVILALGGCFIVILLEPPPTERLWRIELHNAHGLERVGLIWAYRILHRKQNERKKKEDGKKGKNGRASRRGLAGSQSLSASRSLSAGVADLRVRGNKPLSRDDANHHELPRGGHTGEAASEVQNSRGANSESSSASPRPAHESGKNRPSDSEDGSAKSLSDSSGNGGRAGSLMDEYDAPFWKKLVTHAEELGL